MTTRIKWDKTTTHDFIKHFINAMSSENQRLRDKIKKMEQKKYCPFCGEKLLNEVK